MSRKKMGSRLADSLKQARQSGKTSRRAEDKPAPRTPSPPRTGSPRTTKAKTARTAVTGHFANQADQSPAASLDQPWDNLHPERIWPD